MVRHAPCAICAKERTWKLMQFVIFSMGELVPGCKYWRHGFLKVIYRCVCVRERERERERERDLRMNTYLTQPATINVLLLLLLLLLLLQIRL